jgi:glycosyl transferase, family 25
MLEDVAIYQINLDHRTDRWQECLNNHAAMGFAEGSVQRLPACLEKDYPALGCTKSHLKCLTRFLTEDSRPYCMVIEDDFDFALGRAALAGKLGALVRSGVAWDVMLLSASAVNGFGSDVPGFARVFESLTTAGYIVKRVYVPELMGAFLTSLAALEKFRGHTPREMITSRFACDVTWQRLQRTGNWFIPIPSAGGQRPSYSDIEKRDVDYSTFSL